MIVSIEKPTIFVNKIVELLKELKELKKKEFGSENAFWFSKNNRIELFQNNYKSMQDIKILASGITLKSKELLAEVVLNENDIIKTLDFKLELLDKKLLIAIIDILNKEILMEGK